VLVHNLFVKLLQAAKGEHSGAGVRDAHRPTSFMSTAVVMMNRIAPETDTKSGLSCARRSEQ